MEFVDEEQVAEQRRTGPCEAEDSHGHELEVERAHAQEPGHRRAEEDAWCLLLLAVQVHARGLEDVAALVGPLLGLAQREEGEAERNAEQRHQQAVAPVVRNGHHVAEDQDPDRLRQRVGQVVPTEDPAPRLGGVGVGQVRVVDRVVHPIPDGGDEVEEGEGPDVGGQAHQTAEHGEDQQGDGRHLLAAAAVGPHRQGNGPEELGHLGDEGDGAQ